MSNTFTFTAPAFNVFRTTTQIRPAWNVKFVPASENFCGKDAGAIVIETANVRIRLNEGETANQAVVELHENRWVNSNGNNKPWEAIATDLSEVGSILLSLHVACVHTAPRE